ncbi:MAG: uroporphyrinogen-III C-methyltransferase [Pirellula sp.]
MTFNTHDRRISNFHRPLPPGMVYLIGAGPGDPGLITVRGAELLSRVDVILYDGLVNDSLLQRARHDSDKICVGKHGHGGMWSQSDIDQAIVQFAKQGKSVARLKGGDTAIFARTSEEVDRLIEEGIPFEIVPGITAALAASAYAGIPMTHRDWSSAVALVTGQLQYSEGAIDVEESMDWDALAKFPGTLVMYMGVTTAADWSQKLISAGKSSKTPVALVRRCSWPDQEVLRCMLGDVATAIASAQNFRPPVICVVGEVTQMAKDMDWFSKRPWFGRNVWVTSPDHSGELVRRFSDLGANVIHQPVIRIEPPESWSVVDSKLRALGRFDTVVFSSVFGVDAFFDRLLQLGLDGRVMSKAKIAAVGHRTAEAMARHSIHCDIVPNISGADSLADLLEANCYGKNFLFVRNPDGETIAMDRLKKLGAEVESMDVYRQIRIDQLPSSLKRYIQQNDLHAITATSKNIAQTVCQLLGDQATRQRWLSLSPAITNDLVNRNCERVATAATPDFESLVLAAT